MKKFKIEMITPEQIFFEGEIDSLTVETHGGRLGILAGHLPMVIGLIPGATVLKNGDETRVVVSGDGIVEIMPDKAVVLCQTLEYPEDIDIEFIKSAVARWKKVVSETTEKHERELGHEILTRCYARLKIAEKQTKS